MSDDVFKRLSRLIAEQILMNGTAPEQLRADTLLLSFGLDLDSVAVLELVMESEKEFGVVFEDSDISVELFKTVGTLATAIEQKLAAGNASKRARPPE